METSSPLAVPHQTPPLVQEPPAVKNPAEPSENDGYRSISRPGTTSRRAPYDATVAQSLDDIHLDPTTIDELFTT